MELGHTNALNEVFVLRNNKNVEGINPKIKINIDIKSNDSVMMKGRKITCKGPVFNLVNKRSQ